MPVWRPRSQTSPGDGYQDQASRRGTIATSRTGSSSTRTGDEVGGGPYSTRFTLEGIDLNDVDPQKAAGEAVDPDRLLEGEDPETRHPEEANHWIEDYIELLPVKARAVATAAHSRAQTTDGAGSGAERGTA